MAAHLFSELSLTIIQKDKAELIKAMLQLKKRHPHLVLPISAIATTVRPHKRMQTIKEA